MHTIYHAYFAFWIDLKMVLSMIFVTVFEDLLFLFFSLLQGQASDIPPSTFVTTAFCSIKMLPLQCGCSPPSQARFSPVRGFAPLDLAYNEEASASWTRGRGRRTSSSTGDFTFGTMTVHLPLRRLLSSSTACSATPSSARRCCDKPTGL